MSLNVGLGRTAQHQGALSRFATVLADRPQAASAERVLARSFWLPAPSTAPAVPIDLAEARARR